MGKDNDCRVVYIAKMPDAPDYSTIAYSSPAFGGYLVTVIWPTGWPPPAPGSFVNEPGGRPTTGANAVCWAGILPKEVFGGMGGVAIPNVPVPAIRPEYEVCPQVQPARGRSLGSY